MAQKREADYGHTETDKLLNEVENRISSTFMQAEMEMKKKLADWYADFEKEDKEKAERVSKGKLTQEEYIKWRQEQMRKGRRMEVLAGRLTQDFSNADKKAMEIVNGSTADVFALNANYAAYTIEDLTGQDIAWTLYDRSTVDRLMRDNPDLLPQPKVDIPKDKLWNRQHITNAITQGILQGESIPNIANRLQEVIGMDKRAAVRSARTATTGAECAGRVESYKHAKGMGIELQQEWLSTLDNRTRHAHRELDGQKADVDEPFEIDGYKIKYPGDPSAPGYLVYNCRCTLIASLPGMSAGKRRAKDPISGKYEIIDGGITYKEWEAGKQAESKAESEKEPEKNADRLAKLQEARDAIKQKAKEIDDLKANWRPDLQQEMQRLQKEQIQAGKQLVANLSETFTVDTDNEEFIKAIIDLDCTKGIKYNEVKLLDKQRTAEEIISVISGGDQTTGSCSSVAFAYIGQKNGYDVLDFRDGESREWFSIKANSRKLLQSLGITVESEKSMKTSVANGHKMLKAMKSGHEYRVIAGSHAAIVRKNTDGSLEYLELQDWRDNGWKTFTTKKSYWEDETLIGRFGCSTSSRFWPEVTWVDTDEIKQSNELRLALGFINTPESEQRKGSNGRIR